VGIGGMAGSVGAILFQPFVGEVLDYFQQAGNKNIGYNLLFCHKRLRLPDCMVADALYYSSIQ